MISYWWVILIVLLFLSWRNTKRDCLPPSLKNRRHDDWGIPPLTWIPRGWTIVCGKNWPEPPILIAGDAGWRREHKNELQHHSEDFIARYGDRFPIPRPHHWVLTSVKYRGFLPIFPYFAITFTRQHFRIGLMRWDDVDNYYQMWTIAHHTLDVERKNLI